jgi:hypothetical protein
MAHAANEPRRDVAKSIVHKGAMFQDLKTRTAVSTWWVHDFEKRRLYLGKMNVKRREGLEAGIRSVLLMAVREARNLCLREVIAWDPTPQIVGQAERLVKEMGQGMTATCENRSEIIPCFRWHGGESKEVIWTEGEYFGFG